MALDDIIKKIEEDAQSQIDALRQEFDKEKKGKLDEFDIYKEQFLERAQSEAKDKAKLHRERLISRAQADANLEILKKKQELLSRVYETALEKLHKMNKDEQIKLFTDILANIDVKEGTLLVAKGSALDSDEFMKKISGKIDGAKFEKKAVDDFKLGFILESGKIRYDNTAESLMEQAKEVLQDKLVAILFEEG